MKDGGDRRRSFETRRRYTLIAAIIGSSMTFVDVTVVNIALPTIGRDLRTGLATQQWIMLSYSLSVASLYIVSGALGDRHGRRRLFAAGVAGFAAASLVAGAAPSPGVLIGARLAQGVAGALLTTNSLALVRATYAGESGRAVGTWTAWSGIGTMLGPPLGGLLVEYASWRWIFLINLPPAVVALALARMGRLDEAGGDRPAPLNLPAAAATAATFGALTFALVEGARVGFGHVGVWWAAAAAGGAGMVLLQRRSTSPLVPRALLHDRLFVTANAFTLIVYAALGGSTFYLALYLQSAAVGYSPARASLVLLPVSVVMFLFSARFGRLADRDGPRRYLTVGPLVMAAGLLLLMLVTDRNPLTPVPGVLTLAAGLAITVAPITSTALRAAPERLSGVAAGVNTTVSRLGGLIATPLLGVVVSLVFAAGSPGHHSDPFATTGLSAGARGATVDAFRAAAGVAAALCVAGGVLAAVALPRRTELDAGTKQM